MSDSSKGAAPPKPADTCADVQAMCETARAMVREQPLSALAIGAAIGFVLGVLGASRPR
jgi:ElaB/YqjD/DUF883 family membrane-anchored ribosome-binding protein